MKTEVLILLSFFLASQLMAQPDGVVASRMVELFKPIHLLSATEDVEDNRLYIACHDGRVWIYEGDSLKVTPFLNIGEGGLDICHFGTNAEQGLNGFTFDPNFSENGICYVTYNGFRPDGTGDEIEQRLMAFKQSDSDPDQVDYTQWYELLEFDEGDDPQDGHNGGQIAFGPDGYMYVSCGDGGSTGNGSPGGGSNGDDHGEFGNGQNLQTFLGKILRIEAHGLEPYTIPADNPFVDDAEALDEIWAYGLRNPWKFSFDRETGDMFVADVGEVDWEEINMISPDEPYGLNFGWRLMEGSYCYEPVEGCNPEGNLRLPIFDYHHSDGLCATVGGTVYRGSNIPSLTGYLIVADFCGFWDVKFWILSGAGQNWQAKPFEIEVPGGFTPWDENSYGFAEDNKGEMYLCTSLAVYKLESDPTSTGPDLDGNIRVFPNPTQSILTVDVGEFTDIQEVRVWDSNGRKVWDRRDLNLTRTFDIDTKTLGDGVFTLQILYKEDSKLETTRFMVGIE